MANIGMKQATGLFITGAMVGAAVALLYAPQSGARTKRDLRKFASKTVDRLEDMQNEVTEFVSDMTESVRDGIARGKKLTSEGYEQVLQGFDNAKKCVEDGRHLVQQLIKKTA